MKFCALLSGGKDSCCNIWKCESEGHELVCLANLCPPDGAGEELNSFMYQSAAHGVIPKLAECFGVPLVRQEITGTAVCQDLDYSQGDDARRDEVEDLYELLLQVVRRFPDVKGVSCGAILSTYQRLRVEDVCKRLHLTPLTYLWQMDRETLLNELCENNFEVVLVKVAGAGLDPYKHLGKSLSALRPQLHSLHYKLGLDLCGEGGEYESLVLDCPMFAKTGKRLRILKSEVLLDDEDCSVGNLLVKDCEVESRQSNGDVDEGAKDPCAERELELLEALAREYASKAAIIDPPKSLTQVKMTEIAPVFSSSLSYNPGCSTCPGGYGNTGLLYPTTETGDVKQQLHSIFAYLLPLLQSYAGVNELADVCFAHLYLSDMALFAAANDAYCTYFGKYPPSRSCVAVESLPNGSDVALDVTYLRHSHSHLQHGRGKCPSGLRSVLLVQSLSHWAPLCIGPYAQSNTLMKQLVFVSGQIPLRPADMTLQWGHGTDTDTDTATQLPLRMRLALQLLLCLRHVQRVLTCSSADGGVTGAGARLQEALLCTVYVDVPLLMSLLSESEEEEEMAWSVHVPLTEYIRRFVQEALKNGLEQDKKRHASGDHGDSDSDSDSDSEEGEDEEEGEVNSDVPIAVIGVSGLPRGALVEVELVAAATASLSPDNQASSSSSSSSSSSDSSKGVGAAPIDIPPEDGADIGVKSWPIWDIPPAGSPADDSGGDNKPQMPPPLALDLQGWANPNPNPQEQGPLSTHRVEDLLPHCHLHCSWRGQHRSVCMGVVTLLGDSGAGLITAPWDMPSTPPGVLAGMVSLLLEEVRVAIRRCNLGLSSVQCLRIYHKDAGTGAGAGAGAARMVHAIRTALTHSRWPSAFPAISLPHRPLEQGEEQEESRCLLKATFCAVNFVGWEGEQWLEGANNNNDSTGK